MQKQEDIMSDRVKKEPPTEQINEQDNGKETGLTSFDKKSRSSTNRISISILLRIFRRNKSRNVLSDGDKSRSTANDQPTTQIEHAKDGTSNITLVKKNKKVAERNLFFKKRKKEKIIENSKLKNSPDVNLENTTYDINNTENRRKKQQEDEVKPPKYKKRIEKGVLFVNKNRKFSNNTLHVKYLSEKSKKKNTKKEVKTTNFNSNSLSGVVTERTEQMEKQSSSAKVSKTDLLDDKSLVSNDSPSTSSMYPLHINSNYPMTISSDTLNTNSNIEKNNEKSDCEMALLFRNHNKESKYKDLENGVSAIETCHSGDYDQIYLHNQIVQELTSIKNQNCLKRIDKATSTSALDKCLRTISAKDDQESKLQRTNSSNFKTLPTLTKFTYRDKQNQPNESDMQKPNSTNDEVELISNDRPNELWPQQSYNFGGLTEFKKTYPISDKSDSYSNQNTTVRTLSSKDLYASFKKSYISVTKRFPVSKWDSQTNSDLTGTQYEQNYNSSTNKQSKCNSENSRIFNNSSNTELNDKSGFISNQKVQKLTEENCMGDIKQNLHFLTNIGLPQFQYRCEDELNGHINFQNANACLNILTQKLQLLDTLYTKNMKTVLNDSLNKPNLTQTQYTKVDILFGNEKGKNLFESIQDGTINYTENKKFFNVQPSNSERSAIMSTDQSSNYDMYTLYKPLTNTLTASKSEISTKTSVNSCTHAFLSRKFKRDYISVRGKSMKIKSIEKNCFMPHTLKHVKVLSEKSAFECNLNKLYREFADNPKYRKHRTDTRLNFKEFLKAENLMSNENRPNKPIKQSSKLSLCISQESFDEDSETCDEDVSNDLVLHEIKRRETENCKKKTALAIPEHKQVLYPRIYSDFSLENKCNPKAYKYLFKNFQ